MPMTYDVQFYKVRARPKGARPYQARWRTAEKVHPRSFLTAELAANWVSELREAARKGEMFDVGTGLPQSKLRELRDVPWFAHAREYVSERWPDVAGNTRVSMMEALVAVTPVLVGDAPGAPDQDALRQALRDWAFRMERDTQGKWRFPKPPSQVETVFAWLEKASIPVSEVADSRNLGMAMRACGRLLDGTQASADYFSRRRRGFSAALSYAVLKERLPENPLRRKDLPTDWQPPKTEEEVDPRSIGNPTKVRQVLTAVSYVGRRQGPRFVAWFGCMYYAMMRPQEVANLRRSGCELPTEGWGKLTFSDSSPAPGKKWTDSGASHEERGLKGRKQGKGRGKKPSRTVPIPPELVAMLREHIRCFGAGPDGRLFRSERGNPIQPSTYWRVWDRARRLALTEEEREGLLLKRPYDLRHAGITYRLNRGVPATQVAKWAGNSVDVLQRVYAQVWTQMDEVWINRMGDHG
ncbi:tyrosine-type recombinase/integrase [Nocardiopsis quinghaiensis]|uniref:tyrosine-type recombinase/integrase n=1 Tax=Nocardiopsis quinghaiensis TaxID=464995 RepID=UPI00123B4E1C|nr:tyrosine-type recombinase/integrase [Nocardiopsis quinghaiensis]